MKFFVTGATGFIGSHFVSAASRTGHEVIGLRLPDTVPRIQLGGNVRWLDKSLAEAEPADFDGIDAVVHFAATGVLPGASTWADCFRANVTDSIAAWKAAIYGGVTRFVICGSCFEYGASGERYEAIPPTAPLEPKGPYHASKAAATMAALALSHHEQVAVAVLRPFHVFGEGEPAERFWPSLRAAAMAGIDFPMTLGEQVRDFIPVGDVARTFLDVAVNRTLTPGRPEVHNVGTGMPTTIRAFADNWWRIWQATGQLQPGAIEYRAGEVMRYVPELTL